MTDISIEKKVRDERHGRYVAHIDAEAELTITRRGPDRISADHTGVPDEMAGQGVANALLEHMLDDARKNGFRIIPICPFVRKQYARHPEWADLFTTEPGEDPKT